MCEKCMGKMTKPCSWKHIADTILACIYEFKSALDAPLNNWELLKSNTMRFPVPLQFLLHFDAIMTSYKENKVSDMAKVQYC